VIQQESFDKRAVLTRCSVKLMVVQGIRQLSTRNRWFGWRSTGMIFLVVALASGTPITDPWLIVLGASSAITASTTRKNLVDRYGARNVKDDDVGIGEGETEPGTVLFPKDPKRSMEIHWKDPKTKLSPQFLTIRGNASLWRAARDISLGTSLKQLEHINGRPFLLSGFAWDYSGTVDSWQNGVLEGEFDGNGRVILRLGPDVQTGRSPEYNEVLGDRSYSSSHPAMQKIDPRVYEITWELR
jgi:hypothetical protein